MLPPELTGTRSGFAILTSRKPLLGEFPCLLPPFPVLACLVLESRIGKSRPRLLLPLPPRSLPAAEFFWHRSHELVQKWKRQDTSFPLWDCPSDQSNARSRAQRDYSFSGIPVLCGSVPRELWAPVCMRCLTSRTRCRHLGQRNHDQGCLCGVSSATSESGKNRWKSLLRRMSAPRRAQARRPGLTASGKVGTC